MYVIFKEVITPSTVTPFLLEITKMNSSLKNRKMTVKINLSEEQKTVKFGHVFDHSLF
jgi:hypothetical protein